MVSIRLYHIKKLSIFHEFLCKKICKIEQKITLERVIILTPDENYLKQRQELILAMSIETSVLDHWTTLVVRLRQGGLSFLSVLAYA